MACNEYSARFDLDHTFAKRTADFERRLAELPDDAFGWFSKQGWVDSAWEQVDFCLEYPKPRFSSKLPPPYDGPFPNVPVLMLNGDIDLQTPLESAERAKQNWPNSVLSDHHGRNPRHPLDERVRAGHRTKLPAEPGPPRRTSL